MKIGAVSVADQELSEENVIPGQILFTGKKLMVKTADKYLHVKEIQAPGKRMMNAADWARGARLTGKEVLQ